MAETTETPESTDEKAAATAEAATEPKESKAEALAAKAKMPKDGGSDSSEDGEKPEITDKVVFINRCAKVVKGGRRFSFSALVVAGNQRGKHAGSGTASVLGACRCGACKDREITATR